MKKFLILAFALTLCTPVFAADLPEGSYEVSVKGSYDVDNNDDDSHIALQGSLGYFLADNIQVGGFVSFEKKIWESYWGVSDVWGLGLCGEYNFNWGDAMVPYVGASLGLLDGSHPDNDTVFVGTLSAGLRIFVTETISLTGEIIYNGADDDIYDFERIDNLQIVEEGESSDITAAIGIKVLLL